MLSRGQTFVLLLLVVLVVLPAPSLAFGAGNIASISRIEGKAWRHGDIEDVLKTIACLKGHRWTSMMIRRVYFGNWLRDYSQAVDVGTLKGVQAGAIRILVWVLSFMSFGYATAEFEVTDERLGTYRPEEHIDNPKDYADNEDARRYDPRLRGPVMPAELAIDLSTGMKNYIANETGGWATSAGYVKFSLNRSIHFGRMYTSGASRGNEADLCEALRCLGQALHCCEDFSAHSNFVELALIELGFSEVFPHTGSNTRMNIRGKHVYPLVTGTFGGVDFLHSVLGEATDHVTQSEIDEVSTALDKAAAEQHKGPQPGSDFINLLAKVPGTSALCQEAARLQADSDAQASQNARYGMSRGAADEGWGAPPPPYDSHGFPQAAPAPNIDPSRPAGQPTSSTAPSQTIDVQATVARIYPILEFRDKVVRAIAGVVERIPGLEKLIETISERITIFIMSLLAPFIKPIINSATQQLKQGSSSVVDASGKHQYEPWTDPNCTDPTHSLLSKDHFSNVLNGVAGQVAACVVQYVAPRVIYAWENPGIPTEQVLNDVVQVFHHPALRTQSEIHRNMFQKVEAWVQSLPHRGANLNHVLGRNSVRTGGNHSGGNHGHGQAQGGGHAPPGQPHPAPHAGQGHQFGPAQGHSGGQAGSFGFPGMNPNIFGMGSHSNVTGSPLDMLNKKFGGFTSNIPGLSSALGGGGGRRDLDPSDPQAEPAAEAYNAQGYQPPHAYGESQAENQGGYLSAFDQNYRATTPVPHEPAEYGYQTTSYSQGYDEVPYQAQPPQEQYQHQYNAYPESQYSQDQSQSSYGYGQGNQQGQHGDGPHWQE